MHTEEVWNISYCNQQWIFVVEKLQHYLKDIYI